MKKKHLWFLLPTIFAVAFAVIGHKKMDSSLAIISLVFMAYTFFVAVTKNKQD